MLKYFSFFDMIHLEKGQNEACILFIPNIFKYESDFCNMQPDIRFITHGLSEIKLPVQQATGYSIHAATTCSP